MLRKYPYSNNRDPYVFIMRNENTRSSNMKIKSAWKIILHWVEVLDEEHSELA
jgi:hypothetical protein